MTENDFWTAFTQTGKIEDYLSFRNCKASVENEENTNAPEHKRIDSQRTEYR